MANKVRYTKDLRLAFRNRLTGEVVRVEAHERERYTKQFHPVIWHLPLYEQVQIDQQPRRDDGD
jgi:hypothetical protein